MTTPFLIVSFLKPTFVAATGTVTFSVALVAVLKAPGSEYCTSTVHEPLASAPVTENAESPAFRDCVATVLKAPFELFLRASSVTVAFVSTAAAGPIVPETFTEPGDVVVLVIDAAPFTATALAAEAPGERMSPYAGLSEAISICEMFPVATWYTPLDGGVNVML